MPNSPSGPIRRGQLIAPFGVGSMVTVPGGTSLIIAGLDYWFKHQDGSDISDAEEFKFEEWRLQDLLGVNHLRLPPDYRDSFWSGNDALNLEITIPAFRFPAWHFCPDCKLLKEWPLYKRGKAGKIKCPECELKKKTRYMFQVPFIALCEVGHLLDFPWREWVHESPNPSCNGDLRLISTGSATLAGQKVKCDGCKKERNLDGITRSNTGDDGKTTTTLSKTLSKGIEFLCKGNKPWLGPDSVEPCTAHIKGSLRSASNVYFAQLQSSIYLPRIEDKNLQELEVILGNPPISTLASSLNNLGMGFDQISALIKPQHPRVLAKYSIDQINSVLQVILSKKTSSGNFKKPSKDVDPLEDEQTLFRRSEYKCLTAERNDLLLKVKARKMDDYLPQVTEYFSKIMLVEKLQETRALAGFSRIFPENESTYLQRQQMLWKNPIIDPDLLWLPAYKVYGEGIFFEFDENKLSKWELLEDVKKRTKPLLDRYQALQASRRISDRQIGARFILIHTFAHLIMNRLIFDCGYSSASLRERLYISSNPVAPMAGVLIYTADGDSEGSMGGLVRMGKPGNIEPIIQKAIENAKWCSADPVCMEMGNLNGQGPDSCNLAACHNCALVPETACEEFNRFLDRGVVIGDFANPSMGFFDF